MPQRPILQKVEGVLNDVPLFGSSGGKIKQNAAARDAIADLIKSKGHSKLPDAEDALADSIRARFEGNQKIKGELYDSFWKSLDDYGDVPRTNTNELLDKMIQQETKANGVGTPHLKLLEKLRDTSDGSAITLHRQFQQVRKQAQAGSRSGGIDKFSAGEMTSVSEAMKKDAVLFAKEIDRLGISEVDEIGKKLRIADDFYKKDILPFKQSKALKSAIETNEPEKILRELKVNGGSTARTRAVYNALDEQGKQRLQSAFLLDAYEKSLGADGVFSPKTFKSELERYSKTAGILFKGEDKKLFQKISDVAEFTQHSAQAAANPMNGSRMVIASLLGGSMATSLPLAAKVATAAALFKVVTQTKGARRLLTASVERTPATRGVDYLTDYLGKQTYRALALDEAVDDR
jgi:hypothetical protein